jgi:hypothetical protein
MQATTTRLSLRGSMKSTSTYKRVVYRGLWFVCVFGFSSVLRVEERCVWSLSDVLPMKRCDSIAKSRTASRSFLEIFHFWAFRGHRGRNLALCPLFGTQERGFLKTALVKRVSDLGSRRRRPETQTSTPMLTLADSVADQSRLNCPQPVDDPRGGF